MNQINVSLLRLLALALLSALLSACAATSPGSIVVPPPRIPPPPPSLMKQVSPESYSERAQRNITQWQAKLISSETK